MRIVQAAEELESQFDAASGEAGSAFCVPDVYIEKYLLEPRHIEFQIIGGDFASLDDLFGQRYVSATVANSSITFTVSVLLPSTTMPWTK